MISPGPKDEIDRDGCRIHHWENWDKASDHRPIIVKIGPVVR